MNRTVVVSCFSLALGLLASFSREAAGERRVLLAISSNRGLEGEESLRHAKSDARSVAALFVDLGDVRPADAHVLDKALYEVRYDLGHRPDWAPIPLHGIVSMLEASP